MTRSRQRSGASALAAIGMSALFTFAMIGCQNDGPLEEAGEAADEAVEDAGDAIEDAGDDIEDALEGDG